MPRSPGRTRLGLRVVEEWLLITEDSVNPFYFAGRVLVFLLLVSVGLAIHHHPLETNYTGESFLHLINLPFHEAGHLIFMPFGRFMMISAAVWARSHAADLPGYISAEDA